MTTIDGHEACSLDMHRQYCLCRHTFERDQSDEWRCTRCGLTLAEYQRAMPA